jgi:hypothetical protein
MRVLLPNDQAHPQPVAAVVGRKPNMKKPTDSKRTGTPAVAVQRIVRCPRCGTKILWTPAPTQLESEDSFGPFLKIPDWLQPARLSPPDNAGKTHLLVMREKGKEPSCWPAENNCPKCRPEGERAAALWNAFMGRTPNEKS